MIFLSIVKNLSKQIFDQSPFSKIFLPFSKKIPKVAIWRGRRLAVWQDHHEASHKLPVRSAAAPWIYLTRKKIRSVVAHPKPQNGFQENSVAISCFFRIQNVPTISRWHSSRSLIENRFYRKFLMTICYNLAYTEVRQHLSPSRKTSFRFSKKIQKMQFSWNQHSGYDGESGPYYPKQSRMWVGCILDRFHSSEMWFQGFPR